MSTSSKSPNTIRQGGPGASHENAKDPKDPKKPGEAADRHRAGSSSGGGETDIRHSHDPEHKS